MTGKTLLKSDGSIYELCREIFDAAFDLYAGYADPAQTAEELEKIAKRLRRHEQNDD